MHRRGVPSLWIAPAFRREIHLLLVALVLAAGCERTSSTGGTGPIELGLPGLANAHVTLAADGDRVAAAWAASGSKGTDVYSAVSADGGRTFGRPVRVNDLDGDASANGEQPPRVLVKGTSVDVLWVSKRAGVAGIRAAASTDGGMTFTPARSITPSGVTGARGWESAALGADGTVHAVWLDGRNAQPSLSSAERASAGQAAPAATASAAKPAAAHHHGDMRQDIYHAMWTGAGAPVETPVATNVCFCCKTAVVARGRDVFVAWRHLFPGGVRDIAVARSADGGRTFQDPVRVSEDNWKIDACPDDGPAMTVDGDGALHVAWPTLVSDPDARRMAIFESTSRDGGVTFSPRSRVDGADSGPAHPRLATTGAGRSAVVWDELAQGTRRVLFRPAGGAAVPLSTGGVASYPAIAAVGDGFVVAWTDQAEGTSTIRAIRVR
jgi:hypothetical protein